MENLTKLRVEDLTRKIQTLTEELEELEEERNYVLKQTGLHLPGHVVKKFESEIATLTQSISELNAELIHRK